MVRTLVTKKIVRALLEDQCDQIIIICIINGDNYNLDKLCHTFVVI